MTTKKRLRVAAVGLGWVCQNRHLPTMAASPRFELLGAIDRDATLAANVAERFSMPHHGAAESLSLATLPWLDDIDAITIATAPHAHHGLIAEAIALGKHVLTEKPFTLRKEEGPRLIQAAREKDVVLGIVHNFQFARSFRALEADLARGRLGDVRSIVARQFGNPARRLPTWYDALPLGLFYDESPHLLYLLRRLAGTEPVLQRVDGVRGTGDVSTPAVMEALYTVQRAERTLPLSLLMNFEAPVSEWHLSVLGDAGMGIVDLFRDIYVFLPNDGAHDTRGVLRTSASATWAHWMQHATSGWRHLRGTLRYGNDEVFERFAVAALTGRPLLDIGADDAGAVLAMQHALLEGVRWVG